jgi:hypothetical protein
VSLIVAEFTPTTTLYPYVYAAEARVELTLSVADLTQYNALPHRDGRKSIVVLDRVTGKRWRLRHAACGGGCFCDATATEIKPREAQS